MDGSGAAERLVASITDRHGGDQRQALVAARAAADELAATADQVLGHFVAAARDAGLTWADVGDTLGVSKQAVQQRFAARTGERQQIVVGGGLFSRFDSELSETVVNATMRARGEGAREVTAEHLLIGAITVRDSRAGAIIRFLAPDLGATLTRSRGRSTAMLRRRGTLPFSTDARTAFGRLETLAEEAGLATIGTGHLLLAIVDDVASGVGVTLRDHGVTAQRIEQLLG